MAAQDSGGQFTSVDPSRQNPVIFPGVEVTLNDPCQALVLLDAAAAQDLQAILLQVLGLVPAPSESEQFGPEVAPLGFGLQELHQRLYNNTTLRDKCIVLPHVSDSGHKTLLRDGFQDKYSSMPCVGGYIEQDWNSHRKKFILEGRAREWGSKALGVFQTSDSRRDDRADMGQRCTWVKMAECTAESLRQACLARESRIHQSEPVLPARYITRLEVSDSAFMGAIDFEINPQFTAIIGGRGTGKSTILEYLRWAMQDQPLVAARDADGGDLAYSNGVEHRRELIQETLLELHGIVKVTWNVDGVRHVVETSSHMNTITLTVADEPEREVTAAEVRDLFPVIAYSQKQLSSVSIRRRELQRFIEQPITVGLREVGEKIKEQRECVKASYANALRYKDLRKQLAAVKTKQVSVKGRLKALEEALPELGSEANATLAEHPARLRETQAVTSLFLDLREVGRTLFNVTRRLQALPHSVQVEGTWPQSDAVNALRDEVARVIRDVDSAVSQGRERFVAGCRSAKQLDVAWRLNAEEYKKRYAEAQEAAAEHKEKIEELGDLRKEEASLRDRKARLEAAISNSADAEKLFTDALGLWMGLHKERGDILEEECSALIDKSGGLIEAELRRGADIDIALEKLRDSLQGARINTQNWDALRGTLLGGATGVEEWRTLMLELRALAEMTPEEVSEGATAPELPGWSLTDRQRLAILERLTPDTWLELALVSLKDIPEFYYRKGNGRISFDRASAGEQATALLRVLLNDRGGPLIVDQPEDDLNKELTQEIVEQVWKAKQRRQIIFASHDANLVVNGDAELIIFCDYASEDDRTKGTIKAQGAIDVREIREGITKVMEGGKRAFQLRQQKYGF
ncbi:MAG: AAA family ATPase [Sedimentisphaerales bacterium]|nr:AAA family ATPase [Sedimentisphaerales bacterium]